jgi:protein-S-isoprenylcysteine O-methyltransferase Ste14
MARFTAFIYGVATYALMFLTFLYLFAFLADFQVPKTIDSGATLSPLLAALINLALITAFTVPHSFMARPAFKEWWTRFVPKPIERTTYVLVSTLLMILLFWQWQPMPQVIWQFEAAWAQALSWGLFALGIVVLFAATFVIDHFDLFGLRQVTLNLKQKPYTYHPFKVTYFYKFVRHPIYVGWFLIFWATPTMTLGHLLTALGMSSYMLIAIAYEERDLLKFHGEAYANYRRRVPMLIPHVGKVHETVKAQPAEQAG